MKAVAEKRTDERTKPCSRSHLWKSVALCGIVSVIAGLVGATDEPRAPGPQSEKRFPPLQLPAGFKATLFACDPLVEYPSVIAAGPRSGSLFVAVDYLTGLGHEIIRRDEIRLIEDTDGDGYADRKTVFATGFNSIQGLAYHDGTLYVMHAPFLTALRDTRGSGTADERRDLLKGLGLRPEEDQIRLHNANGVVVGHDGWLYLALGDHGCSVVRPEGDRLVLEGGGILRCRPDGRDLHVFATGLRNIYDVALDEDLNVFVRDNENDGGKYKVRVCHSFFGADHGYPYLYEERPNEALPPLADLGLGSSAGGVCYLERQFPPEYRGNLFFCEWGRAVVHYRPQRQGSAFAAVKEIEFAAGAPNDPYGFKPTDLVVDRDGALFVADWADGQRPRRGRGRIYQVRHVGDKVKPERERPNVPAEIARLDSDSYFTRCEAQHALESRSKNGLPAIAAALAKNELGITGQYHTVWIMAKIEGPAAARKTAQPGEDGPRPARAGSGTAGRRRSCRPCSRRSSTGRGPRRCCDRRPYRRGWPRVPIHGCNLKQSSPWAACTGRAAPDWLRKNLKKPDSSLAHAAQGTLRRCGNWPAVLKLLDEPSGEPLREIARRACAEQYENQVVDGLIERLKQDSDARRRGEYAELLARVHKKPAAWVYWGFRPGARPSNSVTWERTEAIEQALNRALGDADRGARLAILRSMLSAKVPARPETLARWLRDEDQAEAVASILAALKPGPDVRPHLEYVVRNRKQTQANRLQALTLFLQGLDNKEEKSLLAAAESVEDGPVLAELLRALGSRKCAAAAPFLLGKLTSVDALVRSEALAAVAELAAPETEQAVNKLLKDEDARVRSTAASVAGKRLQLSAVDGLLKLTRDPSVDVRRASLEAAGTAARTRALPVAVTALDDPRDSSASPRGARRPGGPGSGQGRGGSGKPRTVGGYSRCRGQCADRLAIQKRSSEQRVANFSSPWQRFTAAAVFC